MEKQLLGRIRAPGVKIEAPSDGKDDMGGELPVVVEISSSSDDDDEKSTTSEEAGEDGNSSAEPSRKKPRLQITSGDASRASSPSSDLPPDFLEPLDAQFFPLPSSVPAILRPSSIPSRNTAREIQERISRQFWKAGDYESFQVDRNSVAGSGLDHVRVHPKFLHSNATSHKWALGAIAELLDNALDEAIHGATKVNVDMIRNPRDRRLMLMIEDDGGGMDPDRMRQCMSLGYSAKSKLANTIGQYGNGFKTSTMRLAADVIVFSRTPATNGALQTQSIGMLSYTFLTGTGQDDIVVPMLDYEVQPFGLRKLMKGNLEDWNRNMETILQWCPYETEQELLDQFQRIKQQGTVVIMYNLWEDEQGDCELDFDADPYDIQLRGTNRNEKNISMASRYPNCKHYFTYRYSLRSYASILYLRLPPGFRIVLRGKVVQHHNLVHDMMLTQELTYRPQRRPDNTQVLMATVTIGFLKDAREHIDVQGFSVYHKNRLIKPFWKVWNLPGIQGRGIIGVLEANFVEPAHDKQGFERTIILARLEARLLEFQKSYWSKNCQEVGYVNNSLKKAVKPAPKAVSAREDTAVDRSHQAVQMPPVSLVARASNPLMTVTQTQSQAGLGRANESVNTAASNVPAPSIPWALRKTSGSQKTAQSHSPATSTGAIMREVQASPMSIDKQKPSPPIPLAVTRSSRSPMHRIPAPVYRNHVAGPNVYPTRQTGAGEGASVISDTSGALRSQASNTPTLPDQGERVSTPTSTIPCVALIPLSVTCNLPSDAAQPAVVRAQSMLNHSEAATSTEIFSPPQSEALESPQLVGATDITNSPPAVPKDTQLHHNMQASSLDELNQGSTKTVSVGTTNEIITCSGIRDVCTDLCSIVRTSPDEINAFDSASGTSETEQGGIPSLIQTKLQLEAKLEYMKQRVKSLQTSLDQVTKERDSLNAELEEVQRFKALEDEELRKKLRSLILRARELEAENKQIQMLK